MISIIIVSLNTKRKLKATLNSVLKQTNKNFEIIVIDGDSNDGTKEYILKNKKKINQFKIEKDKGIYDAMNKGIGLAKKKWSIFLNSGDVFHDKQVIKKIHKYLKVSDQPDIIIGRNKVRRDGYIYDTKVKFLSANSLNSSFSHQSVFTKSNLLRKNKFNLNYQFAADFDFFIKMLKKRRKFSYIDDYVSISEPKGISDENKIDVYKEFKKISTKHYYSYKKEYLYFAIFIKIYFLELIKLLLPNKIIKYILKRKYKGIN